MLGFFLVSWLVFVRLTLKETVLDLRLATAPRHTAVVEQDLTGQNTLILHWTGDNGLPRYGKPDGTEHYAEGQHVAVVEYDGAACWTWTTPDEADTDVRVAGICLAGIPGALVIAYLVRRRRRWQGLLQAAERPPGWGVGGSVLFPQPEIVGWVEPGGRPCLRVRLNGRVGYVPLLRGQFVTTLDPRHDLTPLTAARPNLVVFRVAGTRRVVWPGGRFRRWTPPVGAIVTWVLFLGGPGLLSLVVHLTTAPISGC